VKSAQFLFSNPTRATVFPEEYGVSVHTVSRPSGRGGIASGSDASGGTSHAIGGVSRQHYRGLSSATIAQRTLSFVSEPESCVGRKLLVASLGVAAVSYVACSRDAGTPVPPPPREPSEASAPPTGDASPEEMASAMRKAAQEALREAREPRPKPDVDQPVGNLMPPPRRRGDSGCDPADPLCGK
jgi:hypothetical protein